MNRKPTPLFWITLLLSMAIMVYEIALTRVFSVILNYHFVFVVISFAMLGLGIGSLIQGIWTRKWERNSTLRWWLFTGGAISFPLCGLLLVSLPLTTGVSFTQPAFYLYLVISTIPFLFSGLNISWIFQTWAGKASKLYAGDLLGAAGGAIVAWILLENMNGLGAVTGAGVIAGVGAAYYGTQISRQLIRPVVPVVGTAIFFVGSFFSVYPSIPIGQDLQKDLYRINRGGGESEIVESRWSAFGRTDLVRIPGNHHELSLYIDGAAGTPMVHMDSTMTSPEKLQAMSAWAIQFYPFMFLKTHEKETAFIIGPGGGKDILIAESSGVKEITAVEVNPDMIDLVRDYSEYNGGIYTPRDNLNLILGEGRQVLRSSKQTYDIISLALPITKSGRSVESYALTEDYLFTVQAFEDYLDHLTPEGRIMILAHGEPEVLRLISSALQAFSNHGIPNTDATNHMYTISDGMMALLVITRQPLTRPEVIQRHQTMHQFHLHNPVAFFPYIDQKPVHLMPRNNQHIEVPMFNQALVDINTGLFSAGVAFLDYHMDVSPVTDDQPFFYNFSRGIPYTLSMLFIVFSILLGYATHRVRQKIQREFFSGQSASVPRLFIAIFTLLGFAFMVTELTLFQKILPYFRHPALALMIVLVVLLSGTGVGSLLSQYIRSQNLLRWSRRIAMQISVLLAGFLALEFLLPDSSLVITRSIMITYLFLVGIALGMPFPILLRYLHKIKMQTVIPYMWGINGIASVTGSVTGVILAMWFGWNIVTMFAGISYLSLILVLYWLQSSVQRMKTPKTGVSVLLSSGIESLSEELSINP